MTERPSGTVTFLFTDLEGSTGLWERDGVVMNAALRAHDALLSECLAGHGGYVFSRAGDSFAVAFSSAADAIHAAIAAQVGIDRLDAPVPLRVRMAAHTGEAFERDGDYFGPTVNRAARLMAAAHGGQVLCSLVTAELARPLLDSALTLRDLGTHRLKDLLAPETVLQVDAPERPVSFPQLRTLDAGRHNLPVQPTRLIGREKEVASLLQQLARSRLVTLTGIGGCGKTRLALAVAAELAAGSSDGVFFVPLATTTGSTAVVETITQAMGIQLAGHDADNLAAFLANQNVVIVLDNCEHLLDEVADVVDTILTRAPDCRILATSREAIGISGEHVVRVPSLAVSDETNDKTNDKTNDADDSPALALLIERARAAGADLTLSSASRQVLTDICRRLDGIPLAIELAAAQLNVLTPVDVLQRLDQRFDLLVGGHGRRRQRQQTLQAMMDWSWELLSIEEQRLLAALSVFTGQWSLDSAETLGAGRLVAPVAVVLRSLVAKSLVEPVYSTQRSQFRLLETVRMFASSQLLAMGSAEAVRSAHAQLHLARSRVITPENAYLDIDTIESVSQEIADIDVAIAWSVGQSAWSEASELAVYSSGSWTAGLQSRNGVEWVQVIEAHLDDPVVRGRLLAIGGYAAIAAGRHDLTRSWERQAFDATIGHDHFAAVLAGSLCAAGLIIPDPEQARHYLLAARSAAVQQRSSMLVGSAQMWINIAALCQPTLDLPVAADDDVDAFGGPGSTGWSIGRQVGALRLAEQQQYQEAMALLGPAEVLQLRRPADDAHRAAVEAMAGDPLAALEQAKGVIHAVKRQSDIVFHGELALIIGIALSRCGRWADAVEHIEAAKRSPMIFPHWYALARRFGRTARSNLDPAEATQILDTARTLTVNQLLERMLDRTARPEPGTNLAQ